MNVGALQSSALSGSRIETQPSIASCGQKAVFVIDTLLLGITNSSQNTSNPRVRPRDEILFGTRKEET